MGIGGCEFPGGVSARTPDSRAAANLSRVAGSSPTTQPPRVERLKAVAPELAEDSLPRPVLRGFHVLVGGGRAGERVLRFRRFSMCGSPPSPRIQEDGARRACDCAVKRLGAARSRPGAIVRFRPRPAV